MHPVDPRVASFSLC